MVDLAGAAVVAILTRAPSHGGKSRLFAELHRPPDPALLSALLLDTLDGTDVPGITRVIAVEPAQACAEMARLVGEDVEVVPQRPGTLGERMRAVMADLFERGAAAVLLVGSDLPDIEPRILVDALARLQQSADALVLGPAADGGYYLIGSTRIPPVFEGIEWGTGRVLAQTVAAAERHGLKVVLIDRLADVDTVADLRRVAASRTRAWLEAFRGRNEGIWLI